MHTAATVAPSWPTGRIVPQSSLSGWTKKPGTAHLSDLTFLLVEERQQGDGNEGDQT